MNIIINGGTRGIGKEVVHNLAITQTQRAIHIRDGVVVEENQ